MRNLFFNRNRDASRALTDLEHTQLGVHLQAVWVIPIKEKIRVAAGGGPSFFSVDQSLITSVGDPAEIGAPFTTVAIGAPTASTVSVSGVGGNVGVDVTYMVTERFGGGLFARWTGGTQSVDVGGFQSGIGLRIKF